MYTFPKEYHCPKGHVFNWTPSSSLWHLTRDGVPLCPECVEGHLASLLGLPKAVAVIKYNERIPLADSKA